MVDQLLGLEDFAWRGLVLIDTHVGQLFYVDLSIGESFGIHHVRLFSVRMYDVTTIKGKQR
jgi:hypothetical protein